MQRDETFLKMRDDLYQKHPVITAKAVIPTPTVLRAYSLLRRERVKSMLQLFALSWYRPFNRRFEINVSEDVFQKRTLPHFSVVLCFVQDDGAPLEFVAQ